MNIVNMIKEYTVKTPDRPVIIEKNRKITYKEIDTNSSKIVTFLKEKGIESGDAVLIFIPMSIDLYVLLVALFKMKAKAVFIDPYADSLFIEKCCRNAHPKAMIGKNISFLLGIKNSEIRKIPIKISTGMHIGFGIKFVDYIKCTENKILEETKEDTPALVTFTSGSTGEPKAIVRSHGFLEKQHTALTNSLEMNRSENMLVSFPIFVLTNMAAGVTSILPDGNSTQPKKINAEKIIRQMSRTVVDTILVPPMLLDRITEKIKNNSMAAKNIKYIYTGGAPVFPILLEKCSEMYKNAEINAVYGASEAEPIARLDYSDVKIEDLNLMKNGHGLLAGRISSDIKLRFANKEGAIIDSYKSGEICVTGDHVLKGYLNGNGFEESKINYEGEVWHKTGDGGYRDKEGRLWLTGRISAEVENEGKWYFPLCVETPLTWIGGLKKAALAIKSNEPCVYVEMEGHTKYGEVEELVNKTGIKRIVKIRKIPVDKRHNGKVLYKKLGG